MFAPAIGVGDDWVCQVTDQCGVSRSLDSDGDSNAKWDIGAFELDFLSVPLPGLSQWGLIVLGGILATIFLWRTGHVGPTKRSVSVSKRFR